MSHPMIIISVGGSTIIPDKGFQIIFLKQFISLLIAQAKKGKRFCLVIGGGSTARNYAQAANKINKLSQSDLDWIGISATWLNAEFFRLLLGKHAYEKIIKDPTKKINTKKPIIIAGGWKPGWSTDYDAVLLAKIFKSSEIINISNIDYVYTADPNIYKNAQKLEHITWPEMRKIVGDKWTPGGHLPFDPLAVKLAQKLKLTVRFVKGDKMENIAKALKGDRKIIGSVVS